MRVVVQGDSATRSSAERTVIDLIRSWTGQHHLPGLCVMHVHVPSGNRTREVDGLLWTPHGLSVLEVKGFTSAQDGTLHIPANGPWQVGDQPAALHTLAETTPAEQCQAGVYAVRNALSAAGVEPGFVTGLVALVSQRDQRLVIEDAPRLPTGISVTLANHTDLRRWMHQQRNRNSRPSWSAEDVLAACAVLDISSLAPERSELLNEDFPNVISGSDRSRQYRPRRAPQAPHPQTSSPKASPQVKSPIATAPRSSARTPTPPPAPARTAPSPRRPQTARAAPRSRPSARPSSTPPHVARRSRRTSIASIVGLVTLLGGLLTVLGFVATLL